MILFPVVEQRLKALETQLAPQLMTIERLRIGPAGIGTAESPQPAFRRHAVAPSQPGGVGAQRRLHPFEKHPVMWPAACRTAERQDGTHPFRIGHCPEQRLHAAHGPATDQGELPVVAIQPIKQRLLRPHVVQQADPREVRCALTGRSVARRSRPACAEQVGQHHAVIATCQRAIRTKQGQAAPMCAAVVARNQHEVVPRAVRRAHYLIAEPRIAQAFAVFEAHFAQRKKFLFPFYFNHLRDSCSGAEGARRHQRRPVSIHAGMYIG